MGLMIGGSEGDLEKRAKIIERGGEEFQLGRGEITTGFGGEHFEGIDHGFGRAEIDLLFAAMGIWDLTEEQPGVLGLENDEFVEPGIGFGRCWHGVRIRVPRGIYKREDWIIRAFPQWRALQAARLLPCRAERPR